MSRSPSPSPSTPKRGLSFWLVFLALAVSMYQAAFEMAAVALALPSIAQDLKSSDFVWVGSAYALASSATLPMTGGLADAFGRRVVMISSLIVFAIGSGICGTAPNMQTLIAGRVIQGIGGGGVLSLPAIVLSDMVSLRERGLYNGILGLTWSIAIPTSTVAGGALAEAGNWRYIFYLNLPITAVALTLVVAFLHAPVPSGEVMLKLRRLDWIGNFIIIASTSLCCVALTWAGVEHLWTSAAVLVPLVFGILGMVAFVIYEVKIPAVPLIPFNLLSDRTTVVGYLITFLNSLISITVIYYMPAFMQACFGDSPVQAGGLHALGMTLTIGPIGVIAGVAVKVFKLYRPPIALGWTLSLIGLGTLTTLNADSSTARLIGIEIVLGSGVGILFSTSYFPVLAPISVAANARALAFFNFLRSFGQVWGVTIARLPKGIQVAYVVIPQIKGLDEPVRSQVRQSFADSTRTIWFVLLSIAAVGAVCSLLLREVPMPIDVDETWKSHKTASINSTAQQESETGDSNAPPAYVLHITAPPASGIGRPINEKYGFSPESESLKTKDSLISSTVA